MTQTFMMRSARYSVCTVVFVYALSFSLCVFFLRFLLPADFTVYSYAKDGSLITERPNMKVRTKTPTRTRLHGQPAKCEIIKREQASPLV